MKSSVSQNITEISGVAELDVHNSAYQYEQSEKKAKWYLGRLQAIANDPRTFKRLHADFREFWHQQQKHSVKYSRLMRSVEAGDIGTWNFLEKLSARNELDKYLTKTISYIYLRDLGLDLNQKAARKKIQKTVSSIIKKVDKGVPTDSDGSDFMFLQPWLAKKHLQPAYYWLMLKLSALKNKFDDDQETQDGFRKLVKVVAGIMMHHFISQPDSDSEKNAPEKIMEVVQLGYAYGLTYPFVDDLLDANSFLSDVDKVVFTDALRQTLRTGKVADYPKFEKDSAQLSAIYKELKWAFEYIQQTLPAEQRKLFFSRASVFFEAQAIDRERSLENAEKHTLEELLVSVILKSSSSRLISRDLVTSNRDQSFDYRTFCFGIYNQFNDDIKDIEEDIEAKNLTPYTWYLAVNETNENADNPYNRYWAVVYFLVYEVYGNDHNIKHLFFERTMNAHKSVFKARGEKEYIALKNTLLSTPEQAFNDDLTSQVIASNNDVWFDKLISKEVSRWMQLKREQSTSFKAKYESLRDKINQQLDIAPHGRFKDAVLHDVANYAVGAGGKRIRAIIATTMGYDLYGFDEEQQVAINQLLEYMHSASLIFDDLPSQDDADIRRGRLSTHKKFSSVAKAELGAVFLMMKAIETQSSIKNHPPEAVLKSLRYAANVTQAVCEGQLLDIETSNQPISEESLEKISHFKTGLAIEAALVIPAILAQKDDLHIKQLQNLAKHMGMMFQIRDDLLDVSGHSAHLGKPVGLDDERARMNFVSVKGEHKAVEVMFKHYHQARNIVSEMPAVRPFFYELLDFIIYREK